MVEEVEFFRNLGQAQKAYAEGWQKALDESTTSTSGPHPSCSTMQLPCLSIFIRKKGAIAYHTAIRLLEGGCERERHCSSG